MKLLNLPTVKQKANISKMLDAFLDNPLSKDQIEHNFKLADFDMLRDAVYKGIDEDKFMKLLEGLNEEDKDIVATMIPEQYQALKNSIPVNMSETLFGVDEREPSDYEKSKFIRSVRVLQNPGYVLELLLNGSLTGTEVDALNTYYPELAAQLQEIALEKIAERSGKDIKLDRRKNGLLALLLGVPRINPASLERLQSNLVSEEAEGSQDVNAGSEATMTDVQQSLDM